MVYRTAYKYDMQQIVHLMPELNSTSWTNKFVSHRRSTVCMHLHAARSLARSLARLEGRKEGRKAEEVVVVIVVVVVVVVVTGGGSGSGPEAKASHGRCISETRKGNS